MHQNEMNFRRRRNVESDFLSWKFFRLTIKATRAARDQINRFTQFVVDCHSNWSLEERLLEVNSFIIRQAFGTLMAIEIVSFS